MSKWFKMSVREDGVAEVRIYDEIGMWGVSAKDFINEINQLGQFSRMELHINSYGGEVFDGFAIFNFLTRQLGKQVDTYNDGIAASIASIIFMAGKKRYAPKNAVTMIHNPWVMTIGDADAHIAQAEVLRLLENNAVDIYKQRASDITENEIRDMMKAESYLSAEDSKLYGFVTDLLDEIPAKDVVPENKRRKPVAYCTKKLDSYKALVNNNGRQPPEPGRQSPEGVRGMNCKKCQKQIAEGAVFCSHCGHNQSVDPVIEARERERQELRDQVIRLERERVAEITARCEKHNLGAEFRQELISGGESVDVCIRKILDKIEKPESTPPSASAGVSVDEADKFRQHASNSLLVAAGKEKDPKAIAEAKKDVPVASLHALLAFCLRRSGVDPIGMIPQQLVNRALRMAAIGSSDLPAILENVLNKVFYGAYNEAPVTWRAWMRTKPVRDFKTVPLVRMSSFSDIDDLPEGMAFKDGRVSDKKETVSISTKGKKFTVTRHALVNDDLDALVQVPTLMSRAIARRQNKDVYDVLTSAALAGPNMTEDGVALFHANHNNLVTSSGVVSVTTLGAAERKLMEMPLLSPDKSSSTQYANIPARFLIAGTKNKVAIEQVLGSAQDISKSITGVPNPFYSRIIPVFDAYLQAKLDAAEGASAAANGWFLAADYQDLETLMMALLQGAETPTLRSEPNGIGEALGIGYDIYADWGVGVADYRGIIRNDGK